MNTRAQILWLALLACGSNAATEISSDTQHAAHEAAPAATPPEPAMDMSHMDMSSMQGGRAPPDARDPDYSDGQTMSPMPGMAESMDDEANFGKLLVDQFEYSHADASNGIALDAQAYYGSDVNKLWLKANGERSAGRLRALRTEALWDHAASAFWDTQLGVRHDFGVGPARNWAAFGVQGLAPYWLNVEAAVYVGASGRTAVRLETEYDLLLTQRLILTPDLELNAYGRSDPQRRLGAGVANVELGLRLRYEVTRQFAPYIGVDWNRRIGKTADFARADGDAPLDRAIVAGLHFWF